MINLNKTLSSSLRWSLLLLSLVAAVSTTAVTIPNQPLSIQPSAKPMIMLAMGKDHRLFYESYNDASDIDGDGALDIRFKPTITYLGLFDSKVCYKHNNKSDATGLFTPAGAASGPLLTCPNNSYGWSGNWLNYITTSRIDALRVVLYGGMRTVDTATQTILRRAYIPQDAHSWAKEYTSLAVDSFLISDYTPLAQPANGKRHFFGNLTPTDGINCTTLNDCSETKQPWMSVVTNSGLRVWDWASKERPVLDASHGGTRADMTVRVEVCTATFKAGCKQYSNGNYKPVGLLHDFGENEASLFGLLTGSYDKNFSGGRLRKVMSSFKNEVNQTNGTYTSAAMIVNTINSLRIRDFNNGNTNNAYRGGFSGNDRVSLEGEKVDWGNPIAEIMYEAVRYFAGKGGATTAFAGTSTVDAEVGLTSATWDNPYSATSAAKAPWCARANLLTISDTNVSYDSDQLPGVDINFGPGISSDLAGLNVGTRAKFITDNEPSTTGLKFIGQSGGTVDAAPTAKIVTSLGNIRGLAPEEPTKRGGYYAASVAHYAKVTDLQPTTLKGTQTIDSFFVALASPLPRIQANLPNGKVINLVPFAKSVSGGGISSAKGSFQPTNQIVDFYVERIANSSAADADANVNGGRYEAKFRINFEDVEQGADHDMDAIVEYTVKANANNTLDVQLKTIYEAGGIQHRMGYIISGTTKDGIYLVVQDETDSTPYYLNVPPGRDPGYCDVTAPPADCNRLPFKDATTATVPNTPISTKIFTPSATPAATYLKDPMWYAAKWGGFVDSNNNGKPDLQAEWDKDGDGVPDAYFFVQNPTKLKESLKNAFEAIVERKGSSSNIATNSARLDSTSSVYQANFTAGKWSGELSSYPINKDDGSISNIATWTAQSKIPVWTNRKIHMKTTGGAAVDTSSTAFSALPAVDRTSLQSSDIYDYVRGSRAKEISNDGTLRDRDGVLGDIIHSSPNFDVDNGNIYVGANDGMLHAFNSENGVERFAVIPNEAIPRLKNLASTAYTTAHQYYVDGDVSLAFKLTQTNNTKYLYSMLGRGGKGLFSLKATGTTTTPSFLWEYTPSGDVNAATDNDLGLMLGRPIFTLLNNGKSALIAGNGYNSTDGKAVLYIFIINADGSLSAIKKLDTGAAGDNGLSGPAFIDTDKNGTADAVFAGDLKGNVWKFDISDKDPNVWNVAFTNTPLFKAVNASNQAQPITAPVYTAKNAIDGDPNFGKYFVFFGTGSYFQTGDANDLKVQSWYGITDDTTPIVNRASLTQRNVVSNGSIAATVTSVVTTRDVRVFSSAVPGDMVNKRGWYMDLNYSEPGERIISRPLIIPAIVPALLVSSIYPIANDACEPGGDGYLNLVDPFSGGAIANDLLDVNNNNKFDALDRLNGVSVGSLKGGIGILTTPIFIAGAGSVSTPFGPSSLGLSDNESNRYYDGNGKDITGKETDCNTSGFLGVGADQGKLGIGVNCKKGGTLKGRISWREILKD
jgi:type IV pilus assembly protein PilY1